MAFTTSAAVSKKKKRLVNRRKRLLDANTIIDYKNPDSLKRFITERGKIIPRRVSGASAKQQRDISLAVKRARFLSLIPSTVSHRSERGFTGMVSMSYSMFDRQHNKGSGGYNKHRNDANSAPQQSSGEENSSTTTNSEV